MGRRFALLALASALALVVVSGIGAVATNGDAVGDSGGAPDIVSSSVDNDAAGNVTFTVTDNQATLAADAAVLVGINSDNNASTGPGGIDYLFSVSAGGYDFAMWNSATNNFA